MCQSKKELQVKLEYELFFGGLVEGYTHALQFTLNKNPKVENYLRTHFLWWGTSEC